MQLVGLVCGGRCSCAMVHFISLSMFVCSAAVRHFWVWSAYGLGLLRHLVLESELFVTVLVEVSLYCCWIGVFSMLVRVFGVIHIIEQTPGGKRMEKNYY